MRQAEEDRKRQEKCAREVFELKYQICPHLEISEYCKKQSCRTSKNS